MFCTSWIHRPNLGVSGLSSKRCFCSRPPRRLAEAPHFFKIRGISKFGVYFSRILLKADILAPGALHSPKDITVNSQRTHMQWYRNLIITSCDGRKDQRWHFSRKLCISIVKNCIYRIKVTKKKHISIWKKTSLVKIHAPRTWSNKSPIWGMGVRFVAVNAFPFCESTHNRS